MFKRKSFKSPEKVRKSSALEKLTEQTIGSQQQQQECKPLDKFIPYVKKKILTNLGRRKK